MTPLTKSLINDRWTAFRQKDWKSYNHLKLKVKKEILNAKRIWANKLISASPGGLWKMVKNENQSHGSMETLIRQYGSVESLLREIHASLSTQFADHNLSHKQLLTPTDRHPSVTAGKVLMLLSKLSEKKSSGPDNIPTKLYKTMGHLIAEPLALIFNTSLKTSTFPKAWKDGIMAPIPKTNPPDSKKLRFITLLSIPSKLLEKIVFDDLRTLFESAYGPYQHGFRRAHSTTTALIDLLDHLTKCFDDPSILSTAILSYDLSSAFDTVRHSQLLRRLEEMNFPHWFLLWLQSYLSNRTASIRINSKSSSDFPINRGLPLYSLLLFSAFLSAVFLPLCHNLQR